MRSTRAIGVAYPARCRRRRSSPTGFGRGAADLPRAALDERRRGVLRCRDPVAAGIDAAVAEAHALLAIDGVVGVNVSGLARPRRRGCRAEVKAAVGLGIRASGDDRGGGRVPAQDEAEFDTMASWTADAVKALGPEYAIPAACRGSGNPAALEWLGRALDLAPGRLLVDVGAGIGGPAAFARAEFEVRPVLLDPMAEPAGAAPAVRRRVGRRVG